MTPSRVEFGQWYADDSGWKILLILDTRLHTAEIQSGDTTLFLDEDTALWLRTALQDALTLTA